MTPDQIQSEIDALTAEAGRCLRDGERRAASMLSGVAERLHAYMPAKAPEPLPEPQRAPDPSPEPENAPKGVFDAIADKLKG